MNHNLILSTALAATLTLGVVADSEAASKKKEKCYGISLAGQNDCANLAGTHSCAGQSKIDKDQGEWQLVAKGSCSTKGGLTKKEAKAKFKKAS